MIFLARLGRTVTSFDKFGSGASGKSQSLGGVERFSREHDENGLVGHRSPFKLKNAVPVVHSAILASRSAESIPPRDEAQAA